MDGRKIRFQLSLTEFIYNGCFAAANFLSVFLESIGFSAGQIGLISSLISGVGIASQPTWGIISDRLRSVKRCFALCMLGTALCAAAIPALSAGGASLLLPALLMLMYFFFHPSNMMMELWLVRVSSQPRLRISYGSIRSWASIGYALFSLAMVPILRAMPTRVVYSFLALFAFLALLASLRVPAQSETGGETPPRQRLRDMPFRAILSYWVVGHILFEVLYQIPHNWRVTYMVFVLREYGADNSLYGALMFLAGICEVPMLLLTKKLTRRVGWGWPMVMSALILALEYSLYAWGRSLPVLFAAQLLRGFSFALYVSCRYQYVYRLAPKGIEGSTQALVDAVSATVNLAAAAAGGFLLERMGTHGFFVLLAGLQAFSGLFFVALHALGCRVLKAPLPDEACGLGFIR